MIYKKIIINSIIYLVITSLLLNTGGSNPISMLHFNKKITNHNLTKISHEMKVKPANQNQIGVIHHQINRVNRSMVAVNRDYHENNRPTAVVNRNYRGNTQSTLSGNSDNVPQPFTHAQYQILVRLIHAEAGGEPLVGQVAVAAVLLNRMKSGKFPESITANVFRSGEFESVSNGYIWSEPTPTAYKAAKLALQGWDPTSGALYFFNPAKTSSSWIWNRPIHTRIGNHYFAG